MTGYTIGPARPPTPSPYPPSGYIPPPPPTAGMHSGMPAPPAAGAIGPTGGISSYLAYSGRPAMTTTQPSYINPRPAGHAGPAGSVTTVPSAMGYSMNPGESASRGQIQMQTGYRSSYNPLDYFTNPTQNVINGVDVSNNAAIQPGAIYGNGDAYHHPTGRQVYRDVPTNPSIPEGSTGPSERGPFSGTNPSSYPDARPTPTVYPAVPLTPTPGRSIAQSTLANRTDGAPTPAPTNRRKAEAKEFYEVEFENGRI